ncbi:GRAS domain-containing protein, partial [Psidium guajava]
VTGDPMQRLAAWFAYALAARVVKRWPGLYKALNHNEPEGLTATRAQPILTPAIPCLAFAHAIVGRTLLRVLAGERRVHIVDMGSGDPKLWVTLLRGLNQGPDGPPHLRLTCVSAKRDVLDVLGHALVKEAETMGMPFQFNPVNVSLRELTEEMLELRLRETVAMVSILDLHALLAEDDRVDAHFGMIQSDSVKDCKRVGEFLSMVRLASPRIFLLVEQEANHNMTRLVDRFVEGLHYYSAVFDSIDAAFGGNCSEERLALEEMFGREIENIVSCEGLEREERHERLARWAVRLRRAGFKPVWLWWNAMEDAEVMVEAHLRDGSKVSTERGCTMICWHERPLLAVSAWSC